MIRLIVRYHVKKDLRDEFYEAIIREGIDEASRKDPGNIQYDYYMYTEDDNEMVLLEAWESEEALSNHAKQPHLEVVRELGKQYCDNVTVEKYITE